MRTSSVKEEVAEEVEEAGADVGARTRYAPRMTRLAFLFAMLLPLTACGGDPLVRGTFTWMH